MQRRLTEQGLRFLEEGQFDKAAQILSLLIKSFPDNADAHHMLGIIELERGNFDSAFILVNTAIDIQPENSLFYNTMGNVELHRKNIQQAEQAFLKAIKYSDEKLEYRYNLAHFYLSQGQYDRAIDNYYTALKINPAHYLSIRGITVAYLFAGENEIALEHANEWVREFSDCDEAFYYQGLCWYGLNNIKRALSSYDKGLELAPTNYDILTAIGACYRALGNYSIAESYLHKSLGLQPHNPNAIYHLACIKLETYDLDSAHDLFSNAIKLDNQYVDPICGLGKIELYKQNYQRALEYFEDALRVEPNNLKAKMLSATTLLRMDHLAHGWEVYRQAINNAPFVKSIPNWNGENLAENQTLLVWTLHNADNLAQQIMFANMLTNLQAKAKNIIALCDKKLIKLLSYSFPQINFMNELPNTTIQSQIALDCLGKYLNFAQHNYLRADPERIKYYKLKYAKLFPNKKLIGLAWRGYSHANIIEHSKSIAFNDLYGNLSKSGNVHYVCLQAEEAASHADLYFDQETMRNRSLDLFELAAQMSALDQIISVDNYIAHLAGALGLNVYTLLSANSEWYWFKEQNKTPWYPQMCLINKIKELNSLFI